MTARRLQLASGQNRQPILLLILSSLGWCLLSQAPEEIETMQAQVVELEAASVDLHEVIKHLGSMWQCVASSNLGQH